MTIPTPSTRQLTESVDDDKSAARGEWLAELPGSIAEIAAGWSLELGEPFVPGGECAWVAPARDRAGRELVLKVGRRHREAEHEGDALRLWDGDGAVRCLATRVVAKPFVGDPAYDAVQHMLNCEQRLGADPAGLAERMAGLLDVDPGRVKLWLFARCAQEALERASLREPARRLAP
jgi:streptomycin 6-kinase